MMHYNYTISHIPGKQLTIADTLSRAPTKDYVESEDLIEEVEFHVRAIVSTLPVSEQRLEVI